MKKTMIIAACGLLLTSAAMAQESCCKGGSHSFIELQGGAQWTVTDAPITKLLMPVGAVSVGHYFTPEVGARLHVSGLQQKGRFDGLDQDYKWSTFNTNADVLLNLSNLLSKKKNHALNVILVAGVGLNHYGKHDELACLSQRLPLEVGTRVQTSTHKEWSKNLRGGLRLETNLNKPFGISLEVDANNLHDEFNGKLNRTDDWQFAGMLGVSWRFGHKKCKKQSQPAPIPDPVPAPAPAPAPEPVPAPAPIVEEKPQPVAVKKTERLHEEIFYLIRLSDPEANGKAQMRRVADFMRKYKDARVTIVGYADKGTGNAELNQMYSERRAAQCKDELVKNFGCDPQRISATAMGDRVQPFAENDKNRCVIIDATGEYTVYE